MRCLTFWTAVLILLTLTTGPTTAQEGEGTAPAPSTVTPPSPPPAPASPSGPMVTAVRVERGRLDQLPEGSPVQLDDRLVLTVANLNEALGQKTDCFDLRLFLDGQAITAPGPERCDASTGEVWFNIARINRGKEAAWQGLIAKRDGLHAAGAVSLGPKGDNRPLDTVAQGADAMVFKLLHPGYVIVTGILFLLTLILFFWLCRRSGILRTAGPPGLKATERPFSLSRVQMAWWFFLVLWAFLFITMISGNVAPIPASILGLIGIASGTFLGAEVIDNGKQQQNAAQAVASAAPATPAPGTSTQPVGNRHQPGLYGFFQDILSDASGVAFHRFQILVLTIAIGGIFIVRVSNQLVMPDFDTTLLGLMGISSGTYIGAKFPETAK